MNFFWRMYDGIFSNQVVQWIWFWVAWPIVGLLGVNEFWGSAWQLWQALYRDPWQVLPAIRAIGCTLIGFILVLFLLWHLLIAIHLIRKKLAAMDLAGFF